MTPAQCRAARALLDWSQQELADISGIGVVTVRQFEAGQVIPRNATMEALMSALQKQGVEFLIGNGAGEGARLREPNFTLIAFLSFLHLYDQRLRGIARHDKVKNLPVFGYALVYHNREGADLVFEGAGILGSVRWRSNQIVFDPPLPKNKMPALTDDAFDSWVAQAELRNAGAL